MSNFNPASPDYKRLESDIARQAADLQVQARQAKKEFLQRETREYFDSHQEIVTAVERVATRHNISLVLRYDSRPIDPTNPQSVAQGVSRPVVLQRNLDITQLVVDELGQVLHAKQDTPKSPTGVTPPTRTARPTSQIPRR